jgi:hypothetical protein
VMVTPEVAVQMLGANTHNRNLRQGRVETFATAMRRGEWRFVGDPLRFSRHGVLLDGQHRLAAIILSGVTLPMLVIGGLEDTDQTAMDQGARRSFSDVLKLNGEANVSALAAAARYLWSFRVAGSPVPSPLVPTMGQLMQTLEESPGLREALNVGRRVYDATRTPATLVAALHVLFCEVDQDDAEAFFALVATGDGLGSGDSIFALRRQLLGIGQARHRKTSPKYVAALIIKAFNFWREGRQVSELRWRSGGAQREVFPVIDGLPEFE